MNCCIRMNRLYQVIKELEFWTFIAKGHPIFILNALQERVKSSKYNYVLVNFHENYHELERRGKILSKEYEEVCHNPLLYGKLLGKLREIIECYLKLNLQFMDLLEELQSFGREDAEWQLLIEHTKREHIYINGKFKQLCL